MTGAAPQGELPTGQGSPDKNVNCDYATEAFTVSPESGASSYSADLPGDWTLYDISACQLIALHPSFLRMVSRDSALAFG